MYNVQQYMPSAQYWPNLWQRIFQFDQEAFEKKIFQLKK